MAPLMLATFSKECRSFAMNTNKTLFGFYVALLLASATSSFAQSPPANDDFANRIVLTGSSITFTGTLVGATSEPAETNIPSSFRSLWTVGRSVWWTWTAAESSTVVIAIQPDGWANNTNAWLSVFGGTNLNTLSSLGYYVGAAFTKPPCGYVKFQATAGMSYQIGVAAYTNGCVGGPFTLQLTATNPPIFIVQPQNCNVSPYGSAFFGAIATDTPGGYVPYYTPGTSYQWFFNGVPIPGEIYPSLAVHGVTTNQAGSYSVIASNVGGITQGGSAMLTVVDTNPVPRLMPMRPTNSSLLSFSLTGEPGRWYKIESSTNLQDWINPIWLQLTNPTTVVSIQRLQSNHFIRASLDVPTDVCVAQLKRYWWAVHIFAMNNALQTNDIYDLMNTLPYVPKNSNRVWPGDICPEGGIYGSSISRIDWPPYCTLYNRGHVIPDP
jgi:hypothetical protein